MSPKTLVINEPPFDKLRANGIGLFPFVVSLSNHMNGLLTAHSIRQALGRPDGLRGLW